VNSETHPRDAEKISGKATTPLIEMAEWHAEAKSAKILLGRIAGIDETRLQELIRNGQTSEIISSLKTTKTKR
jgi:hypothetical protein